MAPPFSILVINPLASSTLTANRDGLSRQVSALEVLSGTSGPRRLWADLRAGFWLFYQHRLYELHLLLPPLSVLEEALSVHVVSCNPAGRLKLLCLSSTGQVFHMVLWHARSRKSMQRTMTVCVRPVGQISFCSIQSLQEETCSYLEKWF